MADWQPSPYSCLCSAHFEPQCFHQRLGLGLEISSNITTKRLLHGKKRRVRCSTGLNNVLLPTLFTLVSNIGQYSEPESGVTTLFNIVDNSEQCGQQNIVQSCFHQYYINLSVFTRVDRSCAVPTIDTVEPDRTPHLVSQRERRQVRYYIT